MRSARPVSPIKDSIDPPMTQETLQHQSPAHLSDQEAEVTQLSLEDLEAVSGGPQITNDGFQP